MELPAPRAEAALLSPFPSVGSDVLVDPRTFQAWATYDATATCVVELRGEGPVLVWVNRAVADLLGCAEQDLVGRPLSRLRRGPLVPRTAQLDDAGLPALDAVRVVERSTTVQRHDGQVVPVRAVSTPVGGAVPPRWVLRLQDVRGEASVAQDLRDSQERLRVLADQTPVGI
ncbi:MAG: hypothetical protein JWO60_991 [Frankiales bacterium]|nr:hypothetical protein [Frankiales bacterium]